jgi:hypothetical protein
MKDTASHICLCCKEIFIPSIYTPHARYCSQPACRKASKKASQALWLNKPENRDYFCGKDHVDRVRQWRKAHPGYWRRKKGRKGGGPLQDIATLQDLVQSPSIAALVGFLAIQIGDALQDTVEKTFWNMHSRGQAIMGVVSGIAPKGTLYVRTKKSVVFGTAAARASAVRLGRFASNP